MRCSAHPSREAVAVCSYCHRGVCESCLKLEERRAFCLQHGYKQLSLEFTKLYLEAIELAREAAVKAVPVREAIEELERELSKA